MSSNKSKRENYDLEHVVDVGNIELSVRNYIEQKDLRTYLSLINNKKRIRKAVEFGCGYGRMTQVLTEFTPNVTGLEREQAILDEAIPLIPDVKFYQVDDLSNVPMAHGDADVIVTFTFLQHLINTEAQKVIEEMIRCLSARGYILICEETDPSHTMGDLQNPNVICTIGRTIETYRNYFKPLSLEFSAERRIEPGYPRENTGAYMLFHKP